jgi:uncharacterized protein YndB with AHSA1/START domain
MRIESDRIIQAPASVVYRVIADYRQHHPKILPSAFSNLQVEQGGVGSGTVISFDLRAGGRTRHFHGHVDEPDPGRLLRETYEEPDMQTTFEVVPEGELTRLRIQTSWHSAPGLQGWIERRFAPRMMGKLYEDELANIDRYAHQLPDSQPLPDGSAGS